MEKYLPIGTICTVKNHQKKVMIIGAFSMDYNGKVRIFDYKGCDYPEGMLLNNKTYSFNHSDIENVVYMGYQDEFYETFNKNITGQNVSKDDSNYEKKEFATNFKFDENGVVIYDPIESPIYKSSVPNIVPKKEEIEENINNPFVPVQSAQSQTMEKDSTKWSIFKSIEFDENGVVISAEEYTPEELQNRE